MCTNETGYLWSCCFDNKLHPLPDPKLKYLSVITSPKILAYNVNTLLSWRTRIFCITSKYKIEETRDSPMEKIISVSLIDEHLTVFSCSYCYSYSSIPFNYTNICMCTKCRIACPLITAYPGLYIRKNTCYE